MQNILIPIQNLSTSGSWETFAKAIIQKTKPQITVLFTGSSTQLKQNGQLAFNASTKLGDLNQFLRKQKAASRLLELCSSWTSIVENISIEFYAGSLYRGIQRLEDQSTFDLVIWAPRPRKNVVTSYWEASKTANIIGQVKSPVCVVPSSPYFAEIDHISYAVDLCDYDPQIIRQVKQIAALFDAKLTLVHVNMTEESGDAYIHSLEKTISDTIDYPKVHYRFFDHHDISMGMKQFVDINKANLFAMTNRRRINWRDLFSTKSLTMKMVQQLPIPLIAFSKYSAR